MAVLMLCRNIRVRYPSRKECEYMFPVHLIPQARVQCNRHVLQCSHIFRTIFIIPFAWLQLRFKDSEFMFSHQTTSIVINSLTNWNLSLGCFTTRINYFSSVYLSCRKISLASLRRKSQYFCRSK